MAHPVTPPQSASSDRPFYESSPFSDYYTESSPSADCSNTLIQIQLLRRLKGFQDRIATVEPNAINAKLLNAQLDSIESTLNAPEIQTREPTDLEDSGLFLSDDCREEEEVMQGLDVQEINAPSNQHICSVDKRGSQKAPDTLFVLLAQQKKEDIELCHLVGRFQQSLYEYEKRFQEVKGLNELVELQLRSVKEQVERLQATGTALSEENRSLREDYLLAGSELVFLKFQWSAIEQAINTYVPRTGLDAAFEVALIRWKHEWEDVMDRYVSRRLGQHAPPKQQHNVSPHLKAQSQPSLDHASIEGIFWPERPNEHSYTTVNLVSQHQNLGNAVQQKAVELATAGGSPNAHFSSRWEVLWSFLAEIVGITDYEDVCDGED